MRGVMIAGTHSGCGKTTITLGVLSALKKKGLIVQSFKSGPDFIDSGLHGMITGRPSRNLDLWMCGEEYVRDCFLKHSADTDIAVVEGVMGLYDGNLSSAELAGHLGIPVVLVVDAYGMAETAGAIVQGIRDWGLGIGESTTTHHPPTNPSFAGVIFNRVASENHFRRLCKGVRDMKILGYLPRDLHFEIPHRHLGLATAEEAPISEEKSARLADTVLTYIDIGKISECSVAETLHNDHAIMLKGQLPATNYQSRPLIAVARDKAFCFYYEDNLDLLKAAGAELIFFSPMEDSQLPADINGIYIGGGYPELYAEQLSQNSSLLRSINAWATAGRPLYAECGGLMYLSKGIHDSGDRFFAMADIFPFETRMKEGRSGLGYRQVVLKENCIVGKEGAELRGHEFHYSEIIEREAFAQTGYSLRDGRGGYLYDEGYQFKKTLASYVHLHFGSNPAIAGEFINSCNNER